MEDNIIRVYGYDYIMYSTFLDERKKNKKLENELTTLKTQLEEKTRSCELAENALKVWEAPLLMIGDDNYPFPYQPLHMFNGACYASMESYNYLALTTNYQYKELNELKKRYEKLEQANDWLNDQYVKLNKEYNAALTMLARLQTILGEKSVA